MLLRESGESFNGELGALNGVEDIRPAFSESFFQRLDAEADAQGVGQLLGEYISAVPVDNGYQV